MNSKTKTTVLIISIIIVMFILTSNITTFTSSPLQQTLFGIEKPDAQHTSNNPANTINNNPLLTGVLGDSQVRLSVPSIINNNTISIYADAVAYGSTKTISVGTITVYSNRLFSIDTDIPTQTVNTSGVIFSFVSIYSITVSGLLIPLNSPYSINNEETLFVEISDSSSFSNLLLSLNYSYSMLLPEKTNTLFIPFYSAYGGPGTFNFQQGHDYYIKIYLNKGSILSLPVSDDLYGNNETKLLIQDDNSWKEIPQKDIQLFFVKTLSTASISPGGGSIILKEYPGMYLITATYTDGYGNAYYTPSTSYSLTKINLADLTLNPNNLTISKIRSQTVNITVSKNQVPLENTEVQVFIYTSLNNITLLYNKTTDNNGVLQLFFPQNMSNFFQIQITNGNSSGIVNGTTIPPDIVIQDFSAYGQYGSNTWNTSIITIAFKTLLSPTYEPLTNSKIEVFERGVLVLTGNTTNEGIFNSQYVSSLSPGNHLDVLEIKIYSEWLNKSFSQSLNISLGNINIFLLTPDLVISNNTYLSLKIINQDGKSLPSFKVEISYYGNTVSNTTNHNGIVSFLMESLIPGKHNFTTSINEQLNYPRNTTTLEFNVLTKGIKIIPTQYEYHVEIGETFNITGRLLSQDNQPIVGALVYINNSSPDKITVKMFQNYSSDSDGYFTITLLLTATVSYFYLELYVIGKNETDTVTTGLFFYFQNITTYLEINTTNTIYPKFPLIQGLLYWGDHVSLANKTIYITYENHTTTVVTGSDGTFNLTISLSHAGTEKVVIQFISDNETRFKSSTNTTNVTLYPGEPKIITPSYYEHVAGEFISISGTVLFNSTPVQNISMTLIAGDQVFTQQTNMSGGYKFSFNFTKIIGTYYFNLTASNTTFLKKADITITVNITKYKIILQQLYSSSSVFSTNKELPVKIIDVYGHLVPNAAVNLSILDTSHIYASTTNQSGIVLFAVNNLLPGTYTFNYFIGETSTTGKALIITKYTVLPIKINTTISYDQFIEGVEGKITIKFTLVNTLEYNYNVTIKVGEQEFIKTVNNLTINLNVTLPAGTNNLSIHDNYRTEFTPFQYYISVEPQKLHLSQFEISNFKYYSTCEIILNVTNSLNKPVSNVSVTLEVILSNTLLIKFWGTTSSQGDISFSFKVPSEWINYVNSSFIFAVYMNHTIYPASSENKNAVLLPGELTPQLNSTSINMAGGYSYFNISISAVVNTTVQVYVEDQLYMTQTYSNSSFIIPILFQEKGTYNVTFIFSSKGFMSKQLFVNITIEPHQVQIKMIKYYAQYLDKNSWILLYATLDNSTSAAEIRISGYIGTQQIFTGITNQTGYLLVSLPPEQWGLIQIKIIHHETPQTTSYSLTVDITYQKANIQLQFYPVLLNNTPAIMIQAFVSGWDDEIPYSFKLYWKLSTESVWKTTSADFYSPIIIFVYDIEVKYDFYIEATVQFNSLTTSYQKQGNTEFNVSFVETPTVMSELQIKLHVQNFPLKNDNVTCSLLLSNNNIFTFHLVTDINGTIIIPSQYLNSTDYVYTLKIVFDNAEWLTSTESKFQLNKRTLDVSHLIDTDNQQIVITLSDNEGSQLLSDNLLLTVYYQETQIYNTTISDTGYIPFKYLPNYANLTLTVTVNDRKDVYSTITIEIIIQRELKISAQLSIPNIQYGDNQEIMINFTYSYYDSILQNSTVQLALSNGDVIGNVVGVYSSVKMLLNTSKLLPDTYTVYLTVTSPDGQKLYQLTTELTIVSEQVNADIQIVNNGYSTNITVIIHLMDDDNNPITEGKVTITIKNSSRIIYYNYFSLSEQNNNTIVIVMENYYLNVTLTITVQYTPQNVFLHTYESVSYSKQVFLPPEKLSIYTTQTVQYGQTTVQVIVIGEHGQAIPRISIVLLTNLFYTETNDTGMAILRIPLLRPGSVSLKITLQYVGTPYVLSTELNFEVSKRILPISYPPIINCEYGKTISLELYQSEEETYFYQVSIFDGTKLIYSVTTNSSKLAIDTTLFESAGNYSLFISRKETSLTKENRQIIILTVQKGPVIIMITESHVGESNVYLKGIVRSINSQQITEGRLELLVKYDGLIVNSYTTNITNGFWEFKVTLTLDTGKTYSLTIKYLENEKYITTSLFAMQLSNDDTQSAETNTFFLNILITKLSPIIVSVIAVPSLGLGLEKLIRRRR